jgi:hypothetical protein
MPRRKPSHIDIEAASALAVIAPQVPAEAVPTISQALRKMYYAGASHALAQQQEQHHARTVPEVSPVPGPADAATGSAADAPGPHRTQSTAG